MRVGTEVGGRAQTGALVPQPLVAGRHVGQLCGLSVFHALVGAKRICCYLM
jgi:hypothetical protein